MRLTCPNCLTEYDVPEAAVAGRARTLRCAYCGHQWRREAAVEPGDASEAPEPAAGAAGPEPNSSAVTPESAAPLIDAPPLLPPQARPGAARPVPPRRAPPQPLPPLTRRRWPLAVLLLLIVVAVAGLAAHRPIARAWPASAPFFQALGLK